MRRAVLVLVLLAACTSRAAPPSTIPTALTAPAAGSSTTSSTTTANLTFTDCDHAEEAFGVLCRAYDLIAQEYVDEVNPAALATAAQRGIAEVVERETAEEIANLSCPLPHPAFRPACEDIADQAGNVTLAALAEGAVRGMVRYGLDANSAYLDTRALALFEEEQSGTVEGIGALVEIVDSSDPSADCPIISPSCRLVIVSALGGSPAERAGMRPDDVIVGVDGERIDGWSVDEVTAVIRGPAGTEVTVTIERDERPTDLLITRAAISIPTVEREMLEPGIGYVKLSVFSDSAPGEFRRALEFLLAGGADRILFDLQNNPGGSLDAAVRIASEFLEGGEVLLTRSPDDEFAYPVSEGGVAVDERIEVMVLVNHGSASAAEVVSAVLQERGRVTIVGEPTFGKNTVQQQYGLPGGGALKLTVARWVTPEGHDFGREGVIPDVVVEVPPEEGADYLVTEALQLLRG